MRKPCVVCGVMIDHGSKCDACKSFSKKLANKGVERTGNRGTTKQRGYSSRWKRLSERARELQPFCSRCGSTHDLQADHTPRAWYRHEHGLTVRLEDIDVLCGACNIKAGAARPGSKRYERWERAVRKRRAAKRVRR